MAMVAIQGSRADQKPRSRGQDLRGPATSLLLASGIYRPANTCRTPRHTYRQGMASAWNGPACRPSTKNLDGWLSPLQETPGESG